MRSARVVTAIGFLLIFISFSFAGFVATANEGMMNTTPSPINNESQLMDSNQMATGSATESDYFLPYPGILPGHPLFFLKLTRDKMLDFLIRDPVKRVEFDLLMADKRLNMGVLLMDQEQDKQAADIVLKGEEYLEQAVEDLYTAKEENSDVSPALVDQLKASAQKHNEVIMQMIESNPEEGLELLEKAQEKTQQVQAKIDQYGM